MKIPKLLLLILFSMASIARSDKLALNWWAWTPGDAVNDSTQTMFAHGYHPKQPIPFSHKLHAGDRSIPCQYCHFEANKSRAAGIPPVNTCMNCHRFVNTEVDSIKTLQAHFDNNDPIKWMKVNDLPDFVRFSHQPHVNAKNEKGEALLQCQTCHGPVETMTTVEQFAPLQMGWCLECHNKFKEPGTVVANASAPHVPFTGPARLAPVSCNTCHY